MTEPTIWKCLRCGHKWANRKPKPPVVCPKCKSPYYNKPRGQGKQGTEKV